MQTVTSLLSPEVNFDYERAEKEFVSFCNLCSGDRFVSLARKDRYGFPVYTAMCLNCGLVFLNPRLTAREYQRFYETTYRKLISQYAGKQVDHLSIQAGQLHYAQDIDASILSRFIKPGVHKTLLDIGGSTGVVGAYFQRYGLEVTCLDPSPPEAEEARRRGIETEVGLLEEYNPQGKQYDIILMCRTIDHLLDIRNSLNKVRSMMHEESLFFVDPVDFRSRYLSSAVFEKAIKVDHPYYITRETSELYLQTIGLQPVIIDASMPSMLRYVCVKSQPVSIEPDPTIAEQFFSEMQWVKATYPRQAAVVAANASAKHLTLYQQAYRLKRKIQNKFAK